MPAGGAKASTSPTSAHSEKMDAATTVTQRVDHMAGKVVGCSSGRAALAFILASLPFNLRVLSSELGVLKLMIQPADAGQTGIRYVRYVRTCWRGMAGAPARRH